MNAGGTKPRARAVLFDLDGTLADTAPDLNYALNLMRAARQLPLVPVERTRFVTSLGTRGMLQEGFGMTPEHPEYNAMKDEFLDLYAENLCRETSLFPGMESLLSGMELRGVRWGVVTNKPERFAVPLIDLMGLGTRSACVIGGDTTPRAKPHPDPLFEAARRIEIAPSDCVYVGDDERDVRAGRAAGMFTVAVRYGYLNGSAPETWQADIVIDRPEELLEYL